jgi:hypothetical protein
VADDETSSSGQWKKEQQQRTDRTVANVESQKLRQQQNNFTTFKPVNPLNGGWHFIVGKNTYLLLL